MLLAIVSSSQRRTPRLFLEAAAPPERRRKGRLGRAPLRRLSPCTAEDAGLLLRTAIRAELEAIYGGFRRSRCRAGVYGLAVRAARDDDMPSLVTDYLPLVIFMAVAFAIGLALLIAPFVVAYRNPDPEKLSAYECGFNAFDDARMKFDIRFYLVSLLFIIFDLEVTFLFPWAVAFRHIGVVGFWSMIVFLGVLTIGFVYEWKKGALEWD
jgi:NADH-quinone oxidoreductase subunit A